MWKWIVLGLGGVLIVVVALLVFFIPLNEQSGVVDTTANLCIEYPSKTVRNYHVILGQLNDYKLARAHLLPSSTPCGQTADFKLYL